MQIALDVDASRAPLEISRESADPTKAYFDLLENPKAIEQIEPARLHRPLRTFLSALNSRESVFATVRCSAGPAAAAATPGDAREFCCSIDIVCTSGTRSADREFWANVAIRLEQLLGRETGDDWLRTELSLRSCRFQAASRDVLALAVVLRARGATAEQAELRWGLGLARLQQALLFTSRALRQQGA